MTTGLIVTWLVTSGATMVSDSEYKAAIVCVERGSERYVCEQSGGLKKAFIANMCLKQ